LSQGRTFDPSDLRYRFEQTSRVGVLGTLEHLIRGSSFDDMPAIHDEDPLGHAGYYSEIMGNPDHGHSQVLLKVGNQRDDLLLDGYVERGRGLVGD
jgi:hypothetical protein